MKKKKTKNKKTAPVYQNNLINFNEWRIKILIKNLCVQYQEPPEFFGPIVNKLVSYNLTQEEIESEIDMFMNIRMYQEELRK